MMKFVSLFKSKKIVSIFLFILSLVLALVVGLVVFFTMDETTSEGTQAFKLVEERNEFRIVDSNSNNDFSKMLPLSDDLFQSKRYLARVDVSYTLEYPNTQTNENNFFVRIDKKDDKGNLQGSYSNSFQIENTTYTYDLNFVITSKSDSSNLYHYRFNTKGLPKDYKIKNIEVKASEAYFFDKTLEWVDVTPRVSNVNGIFRSDEDASNDIDLTPSDFNANAYDAFIDYVLVVKYRDYVVALITSSRESRIGLSDYILPIYPKDANNDIDYTKDPQGVEYNSGIVDTPIMSYDTFKAEKTMELSEVKTSTSQEFVINLDWNVQVRITFRDITKNDATKNFFATGFIIEKIEYKRLSLESSNLDEVELSIEKTLVG